MVTETLPVSTLTSIVLGELLEHLPSTTANKSIFNRATTDRFRHSDTPCQHFDFLRHRHRASKHNYGLQDRDHSDNGNGDFDGCSVNLHLYRGDDGTGDRNYDHRYSASEHTHRLQNRSYPDHDDSDFDSGSVNVHVHRDINRTANCHHDHRFR